MVSMPLAETKGSQATTANSTLPKAGPANSLPMISTPTMRPLTVSRRSRGITLGTSAAIVLSVNASPTPNSAATTMTSTIGVAPAAIVAARATSMSVRAAATTRKSRRRSYRSANAPATGPTSTDGTRPAAKVADTHIGLAVKANTSNGNAVKRTPSAKFDIRWAPTKRVAGVA